MYKNKILFTYTILNIMSTVALYYITKYIIFILNQITEAKSITCLWIVSEATSSFSSFSMRWWSIRSSSLLNESFLLLLLSGKFIFSIDLTDTPFLNSVLSWSSSDVATSRSLMTILSSFRNCSTRDSESPSFFLVAVRSREYLSSNLNNAYFRQSHLLVC